MKNFLKLMLISLLLFTACNNKSVDYQEFESNDYEAIKENPAIQVHYFTDPMCSACYLMDEDLSKFLDKHEGEFEFYQHMVGLFPNKESVMESVGSLNEAKNNWNKLEKKYGKRFNSAVWENNPVYSSYPASKVIKSAELQDRTKVHDLLMDIRKMYFVDGLDISNYDVLYEIVEKHDLDSKLVDLDITAKGGHDFENDLYFTRSLELKSFPALVVFKDGNWYDTHGYLDEEKLESFYTEALKALK